MKNRLVLSLLCILLVSLFLPNAFSQGTVVRVAPHALSADVSPRIVDIVIENGQNVAGYQVMLQFDSNFIEYSGIDHGDYLPEAVFSGKPKIIDTDPKNSLKAILFAATSFVGEGNGDGILATLKFTKIKAASSDLTLLDETLLSNRAGDPLFRNFEHSKTRLYAVADLAVGPVQAIPKGTNEARYYYSKGENFVLRATVRNVGNWKSASPQLQLYSPTPIATAKGDSLGEPVNIKPLEPNRAGEIFLPVTAPETPGDHYYTVCIEGSDGYRHPDANKSSQDVKDNNCYTLKITVDPPDLKATYINADPRTVVPGEKITLIAEVSHSGRKSDETVLWYYLNNDTNGDSHVLGASRIDSLPRDDDTATDTKQITAAAPEKPGIYYYSVSVDSVNGELDTNNNKSDNELKPVTITVKQPESENTVINSLKKAQEFVATNPRNFESHDWNLPQDFFTDVAVTENATYFVWKPSTPESFSNNFPYKSEITLKIPGTITDTETALGLQRDGKLPSKYPYIMVPLPTSTPTEDANEAGEIFTWWKAAKIFWNTAIEAITSVSIDAGIDKIETLSPRLGKMKLGLWYTAGMVIYDTVVGSLALHQTENAAYNSITEALRNPSITVEDPTPFMSVGPKILDATSEARFLVMIPKPLESLSLDMETYYYEEKVVVGEGPTKVAMRWDSGDAVVGDMHLFFDEDNGRIYLNVPEKITTDPGLWGQDSDIDFNPSEDGLSELFGFWAHATDPDADYWIGYADKWLDAWKNNDDRISEETKEALHILFSQTHKVWTKLALGSIPVQNLFEKAKNPSEDAVLNWFGIYFEKPMIYMQLPKYEYGAMPEDPLVTSHIFQLQWTAGAAPQARSMSLADYPPFQELTPEVQALLINYFGETANTGFLNKSGWNPIPEETSLLPNYPNPFNPETWIPYQLANPADVTLTIYDINGRVVRDLDLGHQRAGVYQSRARAAHWDGRNAHGEPVASGLYFYTLKAGDFTATRKMLIRK